MAWHQGYPLSQSLFTSLHIDRILDKNPKTIQAAQFVQEESQNAPQPWLHDVLRAYCVGIIKICDLVMGMITSQHYYEEEDFVTHTCNRQLLLDVPTGSVVEVLEMTVDQIDTNRSLSKVSSLPLVQRLSRLVLLLELLDPDAQNSPREHQGLIERLKTTAMACTDTASFGIPVPDAFNAAFVQRKLTSTVPPRPVIDLSYKDASDEFTKLCDDMLAASHSLAFRESDSPEDLIVSHVTKCEGGCWSNTNRPSSGISVHEYRTPTHSLARPCKTTCSARIESLLSGQ